MERPERTKEMELRQISCAARRLLEKGWAEGSSGNISLISRAPVGEERNPLKIFPLKADLPGIEGILFWAKKSGSSMEQVSLDPESNNGLYRISGLELQLLEGRGPPTTEVHSHLMIYSQTSHEAAVHCHWPGLGGALERTRKGPLPPWMAVVGPLMPGSMELARTTGDQMHGRRLVVWEGHGAVGAGPDLGSCIEALDEAHGVLFGLR